MTRTDASTGSTRTPEGWWDPVEESDREAREEQAWQDREDEEETS